MTSVNLLIEKYWAGKATALEKEQLYTHLDTLNPAAGLDDFELFLDNTVRENPTKVYTDEHAQQLLAGIKQKAGIHHTEKKKINWLAWLTPIAASIVIMLIVHAYQQQSNTAKMYPVAKRTFTGKSHPTFICINNSGNTALDTTLSDHTSVKIFPQSTLSFIAHFEPRMRRISMSGKVLFRVAKDKKRPFVVTGGGLVTTAIGTYFEVNTLVPGKTSVRLLEGSVLIKKQKAITTDTGVLLKAGKEFLYITGKDRILVNNLSQQEASINKDSKSELVFEQVPLALVCSQLEAEYRIRIDYEPPGNDPVFSGRFHKDMGAYKIIETIAKQYKLVLTHNQGIYSLK